MVRIVVSTTIERGIRSLLRRRRVRLMDAMLIGALVSLKYLGKDKIEVVGEDRRKVVIKVNDKFLVEIPARFRGLV